MSELIVRAVVFAIYPIAMAIRATNVYEEKSLGLSDNTEQTMEAGLQHLRQEEGYVNLHLRDQLAVIASTISADAMSKPKLIHRVAVRRLVHHLRRLLE